ncbi:hypothetical protein FQN60_002489 [Etheostoma spectabile]|uniref:Uncharacterized protein n=1 Tax=Etheostoma spectabile TaxID=54343 RepID=A0A5J5CBB6_9PERO|nr:hypothetical protein FQN60_002489 [Etheostoma spectabile]
MNWLKKDCPAKIPVDLLPDGCVQLTCISRKWDPC